MATDVQDPECYSYCELSLVCHRILSPPQTVIFQWHLPRLTHCFSCHSKGPYSVCLFRELWQVTENKCKRMDTIDHSEVFSTVFQPHDKNRMPHSRGPAAGVTYQSCLSLSSDFPLCFFEGCRNDIKLFKIALPYYRWAKSYLLYFEEKNSSSNLLLCTENKQDIFFHRLQVLSHPFLLFWNNKKNLI